MPVDRGEPQPGAPHGHDRLDELGPVRAQQRDAVAGLHAALAQRTHEPVRVGVDLGERAIADLGVDRDPIGLPLGPERREQPPVGRLAERLAIDVGHVSPDT